ncbi:MAG: glycosyl hydrolase family 18 protein [Cellulosilyticaceae bacterium]
MKQRKSILAYIMALVMVCTVAMTPISVMAQTVSQAVAAVQAWSATQIYHGGDQVTYDGKTFKASWWTQNEKPDANNQWGVWKVVGETPTPDPDPNPNPDPDPDPTPDPDPQPTTTWEAGKVYVKGDRVVYDGKTFEAKWWTQNEKPDANNAAGVWLFIGGGGGGTDPNPDFIPREGDKNVKVVGYFPSWKPEKVKEVQYDKLTHINYSFAIPTADGGLLPLDNPETAKELIREAHKNGVKVLLAVGGWEYKGVPLENAFVQATSTDAKAQKLANEIIAMAKQYGFDGVDMDWEHPRTGSPSAKQYENLMRYLDKGLRKENMLLTAAVLGGKTADGITQYDAAAHSQVVIDSVDWFNVMAYDGGDGDRHSSYNFAVSCASYWKNERHMPGHKVVLGVPFYGRPLWLSYEEILQKDPAAFGKDIATIDGKQVYYNGIPTIKAKTEWALNNVGGIMIWEIAHDTPVVEKSLLNAIHEVVLAHAK